MLIVFGRGVTRGTDGWALTAATAGRVRAAADYVKACPAPPDGRPVRVIFSGGWAEASAGTPAPPEGWREADVMLREASGLGLEGLAELYAESRSRSTLENLLCVVEDGLLDGITFDPEHPLGLVAQPPHAPRIRYLARKVLRLPDACLLDVPAPGPDQPVGLLPERVLGVAARLTLLGATRHATLLRRERCAVAAVRGLERLIRLRGTAARV